MSLDLINACRGGEAVAACFGASRLLTHLLAFEVALAESEAALGLIPASAVQPIRDCALPGAFDLAALVLATRDSMTPVIPFVRAFTAMVEARDPQAARYVHFGATSQDVIDSAVMLAAREALQLLTGDLRALMTTLATLAGVHRSTLITARSLSQHAGPTSFGLKVAGWLDGCTAALESCDALAWPLQFGGATGTLASFGDSGAPLAEAMATRLGLRLATPWHTERHVIRALAAALAQAAAAVGKAAGDFILLAQTEVGELREAHTPGRGGSSALPHKQNPVAAMAALAAARRAPAALALVFGAFDHEHERAAGAWHVEMPALVELFTVTAGAVESLRRAFSGVVVDTQAMRRNLDLGQGLALSEAVSMALAPKIGRSQAQAIVKRAVLAVRAGQGTLGEALARDPEVVTTLNPDALAHALAPANFLGSAGRFIDQALARAQPHLDD